MGRFFLRRAHARGHLWPIWASLRPSATKNCDDVICVTVGDAPANIPLCALVNIAQPQRKQRLTKASSNGISRALSVAEKNTGTHPLWAGNQCSKPVQGDYHVALTQGLYAD